MARAATVLTAKTVAGEYRPPGEAPAFGVGQVDVLRQPYHNGDCKRRLLGMEEPAAVFQRLCLVFEQ